LNCFSNALGHATHSIHQCIWFDPPSRNTSRTIDWYHQAKGVWGKWGIRVPDRGGGKAKQLWQQGKQHYNKTGIWQRRGFKWAPNWFSEKAQVASEACIDKWWLWTVMLIYKTII